MGRLFKDLPTREELLAQVKLAYAVKKYGDDAYYKAPETLSVSRQIEALVDTVYPVLAVLQARVNGLEWRNARC